MSESANNNLTSENLEQAKIDLLTQIKNAGCIKNPDELKITASEKGGVIEYKITAMSLTLELLFTYFTNEGWFVSGLRKSEKWQALTEITISKPQISTNGEQSLEVGLERDGAHNNAIGILEKNKSE